MGDGEGEGDGVRLIRPQDRAEGPATPGMRREQSVGTDRSWAGHVTTEAGMVSGWHHHDRNDSCLYIVRGILRFEFEGRREPLEAGPGDFVHVPAFTVHRESNPTDEVSFAVVARVGGGIPTVNVDQAPPPYA